MKKTQFFTALAAGACFTASAVSGQIVISSLDNPTVVSFADFEGTVDSLPSGVTFSNTPGEGGFFNFDDPPGLSANDLFAFRESETDPVLGLVYKRPATNPANIFFNIAVTNETGVELTDFTLQFSFFQVSQGSRPTEIRINWNPSGTFTTNGITGGETFVATTQASTGTPTLLDPYIAEFRTVSYAAVNPVTDQSSVVFGFTFRFGDGSGNNGHVGISDIEITAIPEPSTYAAIVGALFLGLVLYRRRQNR